jgi:hypothetical protein
MTKKEILLKKLKENEDYEILDIYKSKVKYVHKKCGTENTVIIFNLEKGIPCSNKECRKEKRKKTMMKKYGVEHNSQLEEVKKSKEQKFNLHSKEIQEKVKQTLIDKYGVDNYSKTDQFKNNLKNIWKEKSKSEIKNISNKRKQTTLKKYGVENVSQNSEVKAKKGQKTKQDILNLLQENNLTLIDEYTNNDDYLTYKCDICGNTFKRTLSQLPICRNCYPTSQNSKPELQLKDFIENLNVDVIANYRDKYEIDVYLPDYKLGIEMNGNYWHSELNGKDKNYHINKTNYFKDKRIQILHIREDEWNFKTNIIKSIIRSKLGKTKRLYARKTIIKEVDNKLSKEFLDKNHIQGNVNSSIKIGLYHKDKLVALMTLGKSRFSKKYEYELLRYCSRKNFTVVGGFSKLLKHFIKTYKPKSIISMADIRYSTGNVYSKNNFIYSHTSKPNYHYFLKSNSNKLYSRIQFQKHKLKEKLENYNPNLTEWENMINNNYDRIWDCGNLVYILEEKRKTK